MSLWQSTYNSEMIRYNSHCSSHCHKLLRSCFRKELLCFSWLLYFHKFFATSLTAEGTSWSAPLTWAIETLRLNPFEIGLASVRFCALTSHSVRITDPILLSLSLALHHQRQWNYTRFIPGSMKGESGPLPLNLFEKGLALEQWEEITRG